MQHDILNGVGFATAQSIAILKGGEGVHPDGTTPAVEVFPEYAIAAGATRQLAEHDVAFQRLTPADATARYTLPADGTAGTERVYVDGDRVVLVQSNNEGALVEHGESTPADPALARARRPRREYIRWRGRYYNLR